MNFVFRQRGALHGVSAAPQRKKARAASCARSCCDTPECRRKTRQRVFTIKRGRGNWGNQPQNLSRSAREKHWRQRRLLLHHLFLSLPFVGLAL
jgi:hypothetical protein